MSNQDANCSLYWKMFEEQEAFKVRLSAMMPRTILEHAYEFVCREDILAAMENNDLTNKQVAALMKSDTPLADIFHKWEDWETRHMEDVWACVESRANEVLREEILAFQREGR